MSRAAVLYDSDGNVIGRVFCANDDDLDLQQQEFVTGAGKTIRLLETENDHEALDRPKEWRITMIAGRPVISKKTEADENA